MNEKPHEYDIDIGLQAIRAEYKRATYKFSAFASTHEGWAVLREEVDELWDVVKNNGDCDALRREAIQVGAMALRFLTDCAPRFTDEDEEEAGG